MRVTYGVAIGLICALAAGCSSEPAGNGADSTVDGEAEETNVNAAIEAELPNLTDDPASATERLPCPGGAGLMCSGPLIVRGEGFNLIREDRSARPDHLYLQGALVFENRTEGPVRFAILGLPINARLDNGHMLATRSNSFSGVSLCGRDGAACLQETPQRFQTLVPGDSPVRVNSSFFGEAEPSLGASYPTVAAATVTLQIYVVGADNAGSVLSISLPDVPLRNQLGQ